jgi:hypothetical protein
LLIGDTDDPRVGESVKVDLKRVRRTLEKALPPESLVVEEISGDQLSRGQIDWSIQHLREQATADDTVFCYVATRSEFTLEPLLVCSPTGERMSRGLLRQRLELLNPKPRLIVLLTDFRNSHQPFQRHWLDYERADSNHEAGRSLFQLPGGVIDWTSDTKGQGRATEAGGGELTRAWCLAVGGCPNASTTWDSIRERTERLNKRLDPKTDGNPRPTVLTDNSPDGLQKGSATLARLGLTPREIQQDSKTYLVVQKVVSGSPVTNLFLNSKRYTLVENIHVITKFDDKPVHSIADLDNAVKAAGATATIGVSRVEIPDRPQPYHYQVELDGNSHSSTDDRAGTLWGLRLKPVDVSSGHPWMVVECVAPGSPADNLESPIPTLVPGDRLRLNDGADQDLSARWNDSTKNELPVQVLGPDNKGQTITLKRKKA